MYDMEWVSWPATPSKLKSEAATAVAWGRHPSASARVVHGLGLGLLAATFIMLGNRLG
jgi:hypothetical protein